MLVTFIQSPRVKYPVPVRRTVDIAALRMQGSVLAKKSPGTRSPASCVDRPRGSRSAVGEAIRPRRRAGSGSDGDVQLVFFAAPAEPACVGRSQVRVV